MSAERSVIKYNKLIRDKIPEIIEKSGKKAIIQELNCDKYKNYLDIKLGEELQEYLESDSIEELADLVEVVYAILKYKNVTLENFEKVREKKVLDRGAFNRRLLLKEVVEENTRT